jgi:hypothetical protein
MNASLNLVANQELVTLNVDSLKYSRSPECTWFHSKKPTSEPRPNEKDRPCHAAVDSMHGISFRTHVRVTAKGNPSGTATTTMVTAMEKYSTMRLPSSPLKLL